MTEVIKTYYANGNLKEEYTLMNGVKDGLYQEWHENGQKWLEFTYVDEKSRMYL